MSRSRSFNVACTVRASNHPEELGAHVELDGNIELLPGDQLVVHGEPINPLFGETVEERRLATVTRATWLQRLWTRMTGDFGCLELLEVDFSEQRNL